MKKLLFALLLLVLPAQAHAAWALRFTGTAADAVDGGDVAPTLGGTTNAGDIIACAVNQRSAVAYTAVSSSGYTQVHGKNGAASPSDSLLLKIAAGGDSAPTIVSSDHTSGRTLIAQCSVFSGGPSTLTGIVVHSGGTTNGSQEDVNTAAVTITTANTLVIAVGGKNNDWEAQTVLAPSGFTLLGQPERTTSAQVGLAWAYQVQTTATNISAGIFDGQSGNFAIGVSFTVSLQPLVVTPTFTSAPAINARTSSSITVRATSDTTGTIYGARYTDDGPTPICDQLEAQTVTGAAQYCSVAATATVAADCAFSGITDGTVKDSAYCLEDGSGNDSAVATIADTYKTAAASTPATVSAQSETAYTISKILDGPGSCTAVACLKDSTAPTVTQVLAGNCTGDAAAIATVTDASCEAGTMTLGGSLTRPVHDVYWAGTYGSQPSALTTLADEFLDAPAGYQYTLLASVSTTSWCKAFNDVATPDIAAADVVKTSTTTSPSGYAWTQQTDCDGSYVGGSTQQSIVYCPYDTSVGDWMSGCNGTLWFNNSPPVAANDGYYVTSEEALINGVAMASVNFASSFNDADGDTLTCVSSDAGTGTGADKRPAGTSISSAVWSGTPSSSGVTTGSFTITCTDPPGESDTLAVTWTAYDQVSVPDCVGVLFTTCDVSLSAASLFPSASFASSDVVPAGTVISQNPAAAAEVNPFTSVSLVVSQGSRSRFNRRTIGLGLGIGRFTPELDLLSPVDGKTFDKQLWFKIKRRF